MTLKLLDDTSELLVGRSPKTKTKLSPKQARFVREYLIDLNATQAAKRAGYSEKTGYVQGCKMLKLPKIADAIAKARNKLAEKTEITQERVLRELEKLAFYDPRKYFNEDGTLKRITDLSDQEAAALAGFTISETASFEVLKKFRTADRRGALELIGKHLGMFVDRVKHEGLEGLEAAILQARARVSSGPNRE